ncbi:BON domain-containing protein [Ralstonia mannitolilytica]|uniref:BON domain-containing protein n=1 Tax=Ralstonia mannitolilytica TaxID=105219 RepID=A0AAD2AY46_9RALS|nr:BON domain-containing protein [Ralstonia mannitolilytica]CAJ0687916.1 hypothetical protein LMG18102_00850 [Ralstonia mannitolilytica]CAJ0689399.1 hypothetical protein R77591_03410 [Ralstonia mannitolilytica]CAJ0715867.1 hypothetical protein LMG8323_03053 [Ralstonia mannitolilytica]CAJ0881479.1 hypothetical protein R77569_03265 [Ralstonia mannitolilytica]CAJ0883421.1 hypothetical protein R1479_02903 [Ralstonia mannitolilytica]
MDIRAGGIAFAWACCAVAAHADDTLQNRGNDPFFQISSGVANCPEPAGPRITEAEWKRDSHHRIEHGNHCWIEGRCRLPNAFAYDDEIAETAKRRLQWMSANVPGWRQHTTLWVTVWQRWMLVQGCVAPGYSLAPFMAALREVPDVERFINETTAHPERGVPYALFRNGTSASGSAKAPGPPPAKPSAGSATQTTPAPAPPRPARSAPGESGG